jgi:hypothetical protein
LRTNRRSSCDHDDRTVPDAVERGFSPSADVVTRAVQRRIHTGVPESTDAIREDGSIEWQWVEYEQLHRDHILPWRGDRVTERRRWAPAWFERVALGPDVDEPNRAHFEPSGADQ